MREGVQRYLKENSIPIMVRDWMINRDKLEHDFSDPGDLHNLVWTTRAKKEVTTITAIGGRHRHDAVNAFVTPLRKVYERATDRAAKLGTKRGHDESNDDDLTEAREELHEASQWLIAVYSRGENTQNSYYYYSYIRDKSFDRNARATPRGHSRVGAQ
jgi:hypothetical protein